MCNFFILNRITSYSWKTAYFSWLLHHIHENLMIYYLAIPCSKMTKTFCYCVVWPTTRALVPPNCSSYRLYTVMTTRSKKLLFEALRKL